MEDNVSYAGMTNASNLRNYIPFIHSYCIQDVKTAVKDKLILVIFDGTSNVDEIFNIVFRWVNDDFKIVQKLVHLGKYGRTFKATEIVHAILTCATTTYSIFSGSFSTGKSGNVIGFQRDRASVNTAAVQTVHSTFKDSLDLHCLSHTLCHVGEHMNASLLVKCKQHLCKLLSLSLKAKKKLTSFKASN